jgi:cytochrome c oxidase subunit 3
MNIIKQLTLKPWLATAPEPRVTDGDLDHKSAATKTALMFFLGVVTMVFTLITVTFLARTQYPDFIALAGAPSLPFTKPLALWFNSGLLVIACLSLHLAMIKTNKNSTMTLVAFASGGLFSCLFLIGQVLVWTELTNRGFAINLNPANSYFFLLTGLHALHLLGGFVALIRVMLQFYHHHDIKNLKASLRFCAIYWHYLLLVWLLLFALLTASSETYKTIALLWGI